jgi:hypothetical protein
MSRIIPPLVIDASKARGQEPYLSPRAADFLNDGIDTVSVPPVLHYLSDFRGAWGNTREIDSEAEVESSQ